MNIFDQKRENSASKLRELRASLLNLPELEPFTELTVFATGSYARGEASTHSDIDLFFLNRSAINSIPDVNINTIRLFAKIVEISHSLGFPKFSNDGVYLKIIEAPQILFHLGNAEDDYKNHFTARLLMILESKPVYGDAAYDAILREVIGRGNPPRK